MFSLNLDIVYRIIVISIYGALHLIWFKMRPASKNKEDSIKRKINFIHIINLLINILIGLQLLFLDIFTFPDNYLIKTIGLILCIVGFLISISGRFELGKNWAHAKEYQIVNNQELVTSGIYKYIRHPIYTGLLLIHTGAELTVNSYLFVFVFVFVFIEKYIQSRKEEKLLIKHFGNKYTNYSKKSKMFFPFIF